MLIGSNNAGMTNANMKLIVLDVTLAEKMESPDPKLEPGEFIVKRVVELAKLNDELKGRSFEMSICDVLTSSCS
jgi:ADP-ribose pyrophosphatase